MATNGQMPTCCLLGITGTGKSSTGNSLFGGRVFNVGANVGAVTTTIAQHQGQWRGSGSMFKCVDVPGSGDTDITDASIGRELAKILSDEVHSVNLFLVVLGGNPRIDKQLVDMLSSFKAMFGEGFEDHVMIAITHWDYGEIVRMKDEDVIERARRKADVNQRLGEVFGHRDFNAECIFLDNTVCMPDRARRKYKDEFAEACLEFDRELDQVKSVLFGDQCWKPFPCGKVDAERAESLKKARDLLKLGQLGWETGATGSFAPLGTDVIHRGWLLYQQRWVWAVLRRKTLRVWSDDGENEPCDPACVDLENKVCYQSPSSLSRRFSANFFFTIYGPGDALHTSYEFGAVSQADRRQWIWLVQEAAHVSESFRRIQKLSRCLQDSQTTTEYAHAIEEWEKINETETILIPMEWVKESMGHSGADAPACSHSQWAKELDQARKDWKREVVRIQDASETKFDNLEDLAFTLTARILDLTPHTHANKEMQANRLAADVVVGRSRSTGGEHMLQTVARVFGNESVVHCLAHQDRLTPEPIDVQVMNFEHEDCVRDITGLPELLNKKDSVSHRLEAVRSMNTVDSFNMPLFAVPRRSWVPDSAQVLCIRCGNDFNPFKRRHHCRLCGSLICGVCSEAKLSLIRDDDNETVTEERVCYLCYGRVASDELNRRCRAVSNRDLIGDELSDLTREFVGDALPDMTEAEQPAGMPARPAETGEEEEDKWPVVRLEMPWKCKIIPLEPQRNDDIVCILHCRYIRLVRLGGRPDHGHVLISVERC